MTCDLANVSVYRKGKVEVSLLSLATYISTENMLPNKGGITIASSLPNTLMTQAYKKDDILVSNIRPYFKKIWKAKYDGGCSNDVLVLTAKNGIDPDFLYYVLANDAFFDYSMAMSKGTKMPRGDKQSIMKYQIPLIELKMQKKIARFLRSIDEKIEANRKINDNLCEQIKATYKRIINGSNNLKVTRIGDLPIYVTDYVANGSFASLKENVTLYQEPNYAYFIRNTDLKSGNFDVYVDEHSYNFLSKSALKGKEIIISNVGDVGSVFLCPMLNKPMTLGNNVIMIEPEDEKLRYYLYSLFKWFDGYNLIQGIKGGSAVPKFNKTDFKNIQINLPLEKELEEFNNFVSPYFEKLIQNQDANKHLSELRDSLLPKLMSGEIDVDSIEL